MNIMDASSEEVLHTSPRLSSNVSLAWSRDNSRIAGVSAPGDNDTLFTWDANSAALLSAVPLEAQANGSIDFSPFGGVVAINLESVSDASALASADANTLPGVIQIIVPDPSPERLQTIAAACNAPPQLFDIVQARLTERNVRQPNQNGAALKGQYPFTGILYCAECGSRWHGIQMRNERIYRDSAPRHSISCNARPRSVKAAPYEQNIIHALLERPTRL